MKRADHAGSAEPFLVEASSSLSIASIWPRAFNASLDKSTLMDSRATVPPYCRHLWPTGAFLYARCHKPNSPARDCRRVARLALELLNHPFDLLSAITREFSQVNFYSFFQHDSLLFRD